MLFVVVFVRWLLFVGCCLLFGVCCSLGFTLLVVNCLPCVGCWLLLVVRRLLFGVCCLVIVVCWCLFVVRSSLSVVLFVVNC